MAPPEVMPRYLEIKMKPSLRFRRFISDQTNDLKVGFTVIDQPDTCTGTTGTSTSGQEPMTITAVHVMYCHVLLLPIATVLLRSYGS